MRHFSFLKIIALLFVFVGGFSCSNCGKNEFKQFKAGELSIADYKLYKNGQLVNFNNSISRTNDTINISLNQKFFSVSSNFSNIDLMACSPADPEYLDRIDSISVNTSSDYDSQHKSNDNINYLVGLNKYNNTIEPLSTFRFSGYHDVINLCLIKNPTVDSIKLNIKLHFRNSGLVRSVDTKWLKFN